MRLARGSGVRRTPLSVCPAIIRFPHKVKINVVGKYCGRTTAAAATRLCFLKVATVATIILHVWAC